MTSLRFEPRSRYLITSIESHWILTICTCQGSRCLESCVAAPGATLHFAHRLSDANDHVRRAEEVLCTYLFFRLNALTSLGHVKPSCPMSSPQPTPLANMRRKRARGAPPLGMWPPGQLRRGCIGTCRRDGPNISTAAGLTSVIAMQKLHLATANTSLFRRGRFY